MKYPQTMKSLDRSPGKNWVEEAGGLPMYIRRIANHLHAEQDMTISHAIAAAVNTCKRWAAGGGNVTPETQAKAAKALAEWEAKKAKGAKMSVELSFDAAAHPRAPAGSPTGGQFVAQEESSGQKKKGKKKKGSERERLIAELMSKKGADYRAAKSESGGKSGGGKTSPAKGKERGEEKGKRAPKGAMPTGTTARPGVGVAVTRTVAGQKRPAEVKPKDERRDKVDPSAPDSRTLRPKTRRKRPGFSVATSRSNIGGPGTVSRAVRPPKAKQVAAVRTVVAKQRRELSTAAREQGWRREGDGSYSTQMRRNGEMQTGKIKQEGVGFTVSKGGQTRKFKDLAQARAWLMS